MACCVLAVVIVARLRQLLGLGGATRSAGPSLGMLLGVAAIELGIVWAIARVLTDGGPGHAHGAHPGSHLALMVQLTVLGTLVPLLLARLLPVNQPGPRAWARRQLFAAMLAAPAVLWFWHLPSVNEEVATDTALEILRGVSVLVTGYAFWRCVLGTGRRVAPPAARQIALLIAGQAGALLGLALLLTTDPIHGGTDGLWWLSAVNDQRAAGVLMLVVDLGVMVPLLAGLNAQRKADVPAIRLRMPAARP